MKRTLLALMLILSLTNLAGCGSNNAVTDKDTAHNNPTSSDYQADQDGTVTSNGKTDTADNVVDAADDVVDGAADAVEGVAEGAKDVVKGDDNTKTTTDSKTQTTKKNTAK